MFFRVRLQPVEAGERDRLFRVTVDNIKERLQSRKLSLMVGDELVRIFKKNIKVGGRPKPFKPLALSTLQARRRRGNLSRKPLIDTGKLLESIKADASGKQLVIKMVRYGEWANRDRPFIVVPQVERPNLEKVIQRAIKKAEM